MAPPRKSLAAARLSGAVAKNPQRYRARAEPNITEPLGHPPDWLEPDAADAWRGLAARLPWLNKSHRCIVEIAATLQARLAAGTLGIPGMQLLRMVLGQLCATPTTAGKIQIQPSADPDDELFRR